MKIETHHLIKRYGERTVVNDVNVEVEQGTVVGLLGPNGAGKTTTFYMIVGIIRPDEGDVTADGKSLDHMPIHERHQFGISYLPQEASIFRKMTVWENMMSLLETRTELSPAERKKRRRASGGVSHYSCKGYKGRCPFRRRTEAGRNCQIFDHGAVLYIAG